MNKKKFENLKRFWNVITMAVSSIVMVIIVIGTWVVPVVLIALTIANWGVISNIENVGELYIALAIVTSLAATLGAKVISGIIVNNHLKNTFGKLKERKNEMSEKHNKNTMKNRLAANSNKKKLEAFKQAGNEMSKKDKKANDKKIKDLKKETKQLEKKSKKKKKIK